MVCHEKMNLVMKNATKVPYNVSYFILKRNTYAVGNAWSYVEHAVKWVDVVSMGCSMLVWGVDFYLTMSVKMHQDFYLRGTELQKEKTIQWPNF